MMLCCMQEASGRLDRPRLMCDLLRGRYPAAPHRSHAIIMPLGAGTPLRKVHQVPRLPLRRPRCSLFSQAAALLAPCHPPHASTYLAPWAPPHPWNTRRPTRRGCLTQLTPLLTRSALGMRRGLPGCTAIRPASTLSVSQATGFGAAPIACFTAAGTSFRQRRAAPSPAFSQRTTLPATAGWCSAATTTGSK